MSKRSNALAERLERGANDLAAFARGLNDEQWQARLPGDGRKVGVVVHHVASMYPLEMQLAMVLAQGNPVGVTWADVHKVNADHAKQFDGVTKAEALDLLAKNSAAAAAGIRALTDAQLDNAAPLALNANATLTCQFMLEDHPVRHSVHHLAGIKAAVAKLGEKAVKVA